MVERTRGVLATEAVIAATLAARLKGLLGRSGLGAQEALILPQCWSIHTLGMQFPIDAAFVDRAWRVVSVRFHLGPGRLIFPVFGASTVVECSDGAFERAGLVIGDTLQLSPTT